METYDTVVIGAGIGGLACAAILAKQQKKVLLVEATDRVGGFQRRFERSGFHFEPHFHFLQDAGPNRPVRRLLQSLGIDQEFARLDPVAQIGFADETLPIDQSREQFIASLTQRFPEERKGIAALFDTTLKIYQAITQQQSSQLVMEYAADTVDTFLNRFVQDSRLKAILGTWAAYFGYSTEIITAIGIIVFTESCWDEGIFHPIGGICSVTDKLTRVIQENNGRILFETSITQIHTKQQAISGVSLDSGQRIFAKHVISCIDTITTYSFLDNQELAVPLIMQVETLPRFRSPFCVYLGIDSEGIDLQNFPAVCIDFVSDDMKCQDEAQLNLRPNEAPICLGIPTHINTDLAPEGHDIVIIYTFVANDSVGGLIGNTEKSEEFAEQLIERAQNIIPDLAQRVVVKETSATATPFLYGKHSRGALGWSPEPQYLPQMPDHGTTISGLYLAGQWTRTGGGINNVFASAHLAVGLLLS